VFSLLLPFFWRRANLVSLLVLSKASLRGSAGRVHKRGSGGKWLMAGPCFWVWDSGSPHTLTLGIYFFCLQLGNREGIWRAWAAVGVKRSSLGPAEMDQRTRSTPRYLFGEHWVWERDWHIGCTSHMSDDNEFLLSISRLSFSTDNSFFGFFALTERAEPQTNGWMDGWTVCGPSLRKLRACITPSPPHPSLAQQEWTRLCMEGRKRGL